MSAPCVSACTPWATVNDTVCSADDFDEDVLENALAAATDVLFELSGRQFPGSCRETVRPHHECCGFEQPSRIVGRTPLRRSCGGVSEVSLGITPVTEVEEVKVDGVVLDDSLYRVDNFSTLVRLPEDGSRRSWPCCQDLALDSDQEGTFEVTFLYGRMPPALGVDAAAKLGCEIAKAMSDQECALPERVTNVSRQGISVSVVNPGDFLDDGKTGIYLVDLFLQSYNPNKLARPPGIMSPDIGSSRRVGT